MSDIDGNCTSAVQYLFLQKYGIKPQIIYHEGKQHGIADVIDKILKEKPQFVWVGDAGSNDVSFCATLKENGIDVLISDHHNIEKENPYAVVVNNQIGNVNKSLSGCGVTYKVVRAYCDKYNIEQMPLWDLVAVSIIGDVCSLIPMENRSIVQYGLTHPNNEFLKILFSKCTRYGVTPKGVAWDIAPLCNALARADEQDCKSLFLDALIGEIDAESALKKMRQIKRKQDDTVKLVVNDMESAIDKSHKAVIAFMADDYKSYSGLIAGKLSGKYNKPSFVLRELNSTMWSGSMRSPVDLLVEINESKLAECQGHNAACGILIKKSNLKKFAKWIDTLDLSTETVYEVASTIQPSQATLNLCQSILDNAILWGKDIDEPTFHFIIKNPTVSIFKKSTNTLRIEKDGIAFIKFRLTDDEVKSFENLKDENIELIGRLAINEYNGIKSVQVMIDEYEIVENQKENFDFDKLFE